MAFNRLSDVSLRRVFTLLAGLAIVVIVALAALRQPSLPEFTATGDPIALPALGEFPVASLEDFEGVLVGQLGTPVVVNIWASWCAPCRTEMPLLQDAADEYEGRVVILGIASNDDPIAAQKFLTDLDLTYPNMFDATGQVRVALGLTAYPTTYVFGADGQIRARVNGGISEQRLTALMEDALE